MISHMTLTALLRLLDEVSELATKVQAEIEAEDDLGRAHPFHYRYYGNPKLTGTLRRRSMDLTRMLAELRKS